MSDSRIFAAKPKITRIKRTGLIIGIICLASVVSTIFIFCSGPSKKSLEETIESDPQDNLAWLSSSSKNPVESETIVEQPDDKMIVQTNQEAKLALALQELENERKKNVSEKTSEIPAAYTSPIGVKLEHAMNGLENIAVGTLLPTVLLTELTSDLPGETLAQIVRPVFDPSQKHILIPQGSKILLKYDSASMSQNRISLKVSHLILPNGTSQPIEGMVSLDMQGSVGLHDKVDHHYLNNLFGMLIPDLASAAQVAGQTGSLKAENLVGEFATYHSPQLQKPTIHIRRGYQFNLLVTEEIGVGVKEKDQKEGR